MKTIGLLGGTGWSSTINYYKLLNELVNERLGGYHSAKIVLNSIDYHDIMTHYGNDHVKTAAILKRELLELIALQPDCMIICCNTLHKYYDMIKHDIASTIPVFHAIELVANHVADHHYSRVLLLATQFTMEDGFFTRTLTTRGIHAVIPNQQERDHMRELHDELMQDKVTSESRHYFEQLIKKYSDSNAVILGCTEYPLVVNQANSVLPIIDPVYLQCVAAVDYALT